MDMNGVEAIVDSHLADFQTQAVDIAKEEGMASADTIYQGHLAHHVDEAQNIQAGAEDLMARGELLRFLLFS